MPRWSDRVVRTITPVLTVHATYATGDYVGPSGVLTEVTGVTRSGRPAVLEGVKVLDKSSGTGVAGELWIFSRQVTFPADSAAFAVTDADMAYCLGKVVIAAGDFSSVAATSCVAEVGQQVGCGLPMTIQPEAGSTSMFVGWVARGSATFAAVDDLVLSFNLLRE